MDERIINILKKINALGYDAFLVGGSSRDYLLSKQFNDVDITTSASPNIISSLFNVVSNAGKSFGSLKINYEGLIAEITTFRKEKYNFKSIYPQIEHFVISINEDYIRRDLTINAIYIDKDLKIYDPANGLCDLKKKRLVFIGDANLRIKEDPTRIFRILKFKYKLNFKIPLYLRKIIKKNTNEISRLSKEKYEKEIENLKEYLTDKKIQKLLKKYKICYNK